MHQHYGDESDRQIELTLPLFVLPSTQDLNWRKQWLDFIQYLLLQYLSTLVYFEEDVHIHVDQANERQDSSGEGWVPDQREGVPEYKGWVSSGVTWVNLIGTIILIGGHLHELGDVEEEWKDGDGYDVHQHALVIGHGLQTNKKPIIGCYNLHH